MSAYQESEALGLQADQERQNAQIEADLLRTNARLKEKAGKEEAEAFQKKGAQFKGAQRAALAASGVSVDYGSAADIQLETSMLLADDVEKIRNNATLEAFGLRSKATMTELQGRATAAGLKNKAGATLMGGALKAGAQLYGSGKMTVPESSNSGWEGASAGSSYNTSEDIA